MSRLLPLILVLFLPAAGLPQETVPSRTAPPAALSVTTRLVYVGVIVRDASGHVAHGLTKQDFQVLEDGHVQKMEFFRPHTYAAELSTASHPGKPAASEFSNVLAPGASEGVTALLFGLLNIAPQDQFFAREQMLKFLRALASGQRVALFTLTARLRMVQGFTGNSLLIQGAERMLKPMDRGLMISQDEADRDAAIASELLSQDIGYSRLPSRRCLRRE